MHALRFRVHPGTNRAPARHAPPRVAEFCGNISFSRADTGPGACSEPRSCASVPLARVIAPVLTSEPTARASRFTCNARCPRTPPHNPHAPALSPLTPGFASPSAPREAAPEPILKRASKGVLASRTASSGSALRWRTGPQRRKRSSEHNVTHLRRRDAPHAATITNTDNRRKW